MYTIFIYAYRCHTTRTLPYPSNDRLIGQLLVAHLAKPSPVMNVFSLVLYKYARTVLMHMRCATAGRASTTSG
jgi:hypothetical protein